MRLGVVATAHDGGAGKWLERGEDVHGYSALFAGAHVVLAADNDDVGRDHMRTVGRSLIGVAASVRVLELPNLPPAGDIADFVADGGTAEQLASLVERARPFAEWDAESAQAAPEPTPEAAAASDPAALPVFKRLSTVSDAVALEYVVDELLIAGELGIITGNDGVLKTALMIALCLSVAGGRRYLGRYQAVQRTVCFVSGEDPEEVIRNRADAILRGRGWNDAAILENFHVLALSGLDLRAPAWQAHLCLEIAKLQPGLIVFDPLAELATGVENDNDQRLEIVRFLRKLAGVCEPRATVVVVHHFKKAAEGVSKGDMIRGGGALKNASRQTYVIEPGPDESLYIENVKFSRGKKRPPFAVRPHILVNEHNDAVWESARFDYVSVGEVKLDAAESFIMDALSGGARLSTTALRDLAKGGKISIVDLTAAIKSLAMRKLIDFEGGDKNATLWGLCLSGENRQPDNQSKVIVGQPDRLSGQASDAGFLLVVPPLGGQAEARWSGSARQPDVGAEDAA